EQTVAPPWGWSRGFVAQAPRLRNGTGVQTRARPARWDGGGGRSIGFCVVSSSGVQQSRASTLGRERLSVLLGKEFFDFQRVVAVADAIATGSDGNAIDRYFDEFGHGQRNDVAYFHFQNIAESQPGLAQSRDQFDFGHLQLPHQRRGPA